MPPNPDSVALRRLSGHRFKYRLFLKATASVTLTPHVPKAMHCASMKGQWTPELCGSYKNVAVNPQYALVVEEDCVVHVLLEQTAARKKQTSEGGNLTSDLAIGKRGWKWVGGSNPWGQGCI